MRIHHLKTHPEFMSAIWDGEKSFEVRKDDRGYECGDTLILQEWVPETEAWGARVVSANVLYVLKGGQFGIEPDHVVMQLSRIKRTHAE